jgi:hypothetical protein
LLHKKSRAGADLVGTYVPKLTQHDCKTSVDTVSWLNFNWVLCPLWDENTLEDKNILLNPFINSAVPHKQNSVAQIY